MCISVLRSTSSTTSRCNFLLAKKVHLKIEAEIVLKQRDSEVLYYYIVFRPIISEKSLCSYKFLYVSFSLIVITVKLPVGTKLLSL